MDELDELNAAIGALIGIAERGRERVLDDLIASAAYGLEERRNVGELALDYAERTRQLDAYRSLVRRPAGALVRMK
jgi:hypothetical protein